MHEYACAHTNTHIVFRMVLVSAAAVCFIQTHIHLPRRSGAGFVRSLDSPLSPCVAMEVYQSCEAPFGSHRAERCYRSSCVYICILRQCDVSKYTQQAHTQTCCKDKKHKIAHKVLTSTNTHCLHSQHNSP